jgi:sulfonate transport system substrate-binding protein
VIATSFENLTFTVDPIAASLQKSADDATAVGLLDPVDLDGIYDLTLLNQVLDARGKPPVTTP